MLQSFMLDITPQGLLVSNLPIIAEGGGDRLMTFPKLLIAWNEIQTPLFGLVGISNIVGYLKLYFNRSSKKITFIIIKYPLC